MTLYVFRYCPYSLLERLIKNLTGNITSYVVTSYYELCWFKIRFWNETGSLSFSAIFFS